MIANHDFYIVKNKFSDIKKELQKIINNQQIYDDFIKPLLLYNLDNSTLILLATNSFVKTTISNNYLSTITDTINKTLNSNFSISIATSDEIAAKEMNQNKSNVRNVNFFNDSNINTGYLLENFIVSAFNKSAYNAANSILKNGKWNPIFIYGGVGLGKTHLLNAIGNEYLQIYPNSRVFYISSDDFVRDVYKALISKDSTDIETLKDKYQACDLLLFDDVQYLANKEKINEIFFNIFNHNISKQKYIVMTSDKLPEQLENFENRIKSRFASGLIIQINKPSIESVMEILEYKIKEFDVPFVFTKESIAYIARRNQNDIRKLEGFLNQIVFYAESDLQEGAIITPSIIQKATEVTHNDELINVGYDLDPNILIDQVALAYGISPKLVKSKSSKKEISVARQVAIYVLRKKFNMPYQQIGKFFSGRNHSTIIESYNKIKDVIEKDSNLKIFVDKIYKNL